MAGTIAPSWDTPVGLCSGNGIMSVVIGQEGSSQSDLELSGPGVPGWRAKAQGAADVAQLKVELATVTASAAQLMDELKAVKNEVAELRSELAARNKKHKKGGRHAVLLDGP